MATLEDVQRIIGELSLAYPNFEKDKKPEQLAAMIDLYHRLLQDIDGHLLEAAACHHMTINKWFPSVAELRELSLSLIEHDMPSEEAWIEVMQAIKRIGSYGTPQWSTPRIEHTIKAFGWKELCMIETDQMSYARDQFIKIYSSMAKREHADHLMLPEVKDVVKRLSDPNSLRTLHGPAESARR